MSAQDQRAMIICGFVCIGKTHLARNWPYNRVYDMEAIRNEEGLDHNAYLDRIKTLAGEQNAVVLVGTLPGLRRRLQAEGLRYVRVHPGPGLEGEWCRRQRRRDGRQAERLLRRRWGGWIRDASGDFAGEVSKESFELSSEEYLEDRIPEIATWFADNVF